ncbi:MAG: hypothetical protein IKR85_09985 [Clostridia bacterium]|nr:hypothetical protein [Clostridia bacterium]
MTAAQSNWAQARGGLERALVQSGFPAEFADLLARQLKSPRAIERLSAYIMHVRPRSIETIVDEALAISEEIESWRSAKDARRAQSAYSAWLCSEEREED